MEIDKDKKRSLKISLIGMGILALVILVGFVYALSTISRGFVNKPGAGDIAGETTQSTRLPNALNVR